MNTNVESTYRTTTIQEAKPFVNDRVSLQGWLHNKRESKGIIFLVLRDGSGFIQCVLTEEAVGHDVFGAVKALGQESALQLRGLLKEDERQHGGIELQVEQAEVLHSSKDYPITPKEHGVDFLIQRRHLWLRSQRQWAIMRVRNSIIYAIHRFFQGEGFVQMDAPIFTGNACEGTSTLFSTDFFETPAYLTQSGQLYGEAMAMAMGKIYTFGPTFRAEKSKTRRHLSEFWMIEPEMAFYSLVDTMDLAERFLRFVVTEVVKECTLELRDVLGRDLEKLAVVQQPFARISYSQAVRLIKGQEEYEGQNALYLLEQDLEVTRLRLKEIDEEISKRESEISSGSMKKGARKFNEEKVRSLKAEQAALEEDERNLPQWISSARNFEDGNDFGGSDETVLTRLFSCPVIVYNWPKAIKAFYMKEAEGAPSLVRGMDILAPEGYGEIVGGGERETNIRVLEEAIEHHGLPQEAFEWYLDLRRYGSVPHSGFGLGLERLVSYICKLPHVRESIPFPRYMGRLTP